MAKYRIVKVAGYAGLYRIEHKINFVLFYLWCDMCGTMTLRECETYIEYLLERDKIAAENPKDIVVKTYP
jgi:hypothetical protein